MGKITILSKSSNNNYSYADTDDVNLTANGNFEIDEQQKRVLSANGNIFYGGLSIASFDTSMYNDILQYQLYGLTSDNTEKAFKALSGVQEQLKAQVMLRAKRKRSNNLSHGSGTDMLSWRKKKEDERYQRKDNSRREKGADAHELCGVQECVGRYGSF